MNYESIYTQAIAAAKKAEADFIAKHGEPMYCGFAWVHIAGGNSGFVRWLKANNVGSKHHQSGWQIWNPTRNNTQSMSVLETAARAFADVLKAYEIKAYADSRGD